MRRVFKVTWKVLALVIGIPAIGALGLALGIILTQSSFNDDRIQMENLQQKVYTFEEQASAYDESLAEATAKAEEAEAKLKEAEAKAEELQIANDSLEERIEELKSSMQASSEAASSDEGLNSDYVAWKFWSDGNEYKASGEDVFYSDPDFKSGLSNEEVVLVSPVVSPDKQKTETGEIITIYTSLSTDGFVYSREVPNIAKIDAVG